LTESNDVSGRPAPTADVAAPVAYEDEKPARQLTGWTRHLVAASCVLVGLFALHQVFFPLAQGNQFSTKADIDSQLRRGAAQSDAELAARGILSSGQFGENRSVLQKGADQSTAQATGALADTIAGGRQAYTRSVSDRLGQLQSLKAQIAARLAQNPGIWQQQRPGGGIGDVFAPLGNASAQQMWNAINSSSVRNAPQNQALIRAGYDAFLRNYGSQFGGGGGAAAPVQGASAGGAPQIVRYGYENGVQYGYDASGRRYSAAQLGARF